MIISVPEKIYEIAYKFKSLNLQNKLTSQQVFAVETSHKHMAYVSILGGEPNNYGLAVFLDSEGWSSLLKCTLKQRTSTDIAEELECRNSIEGLFMTFSNQLELSEEEILSVKDFAYDHGIDFTDKKNENSYVRFKKFRKYENYSPIRDYADWLTLYDVMDMCIQIENSLDFGKMCIEKFDKNFRIPLFVKKNGEIQVKDISVPSEPEEKFNEVKFTDTELIEKIKSYPRKNEIYCQVAMLAPSIENPNNGLERFSFTLLFVDQDLVMDSTEPIIDVENEIGVFATDLAEIFNEQRYCPKKMYYKDQRTYFLFKDFCEKLDIPLVHNDCCKNFDELYKNECETILDVSCFDELYDKLASDALNGLAGEAEFITSLAEFEDMDIEQIKNLEDYTLLCLKGMFGKGLLTDELENKIKAIL